MKRLKYIYYRFMWHLAPFLPSGKFIHVDIELNNTCNQKCISCWHYLDKLPFAIQNINEYSMYRQIKLSRNAGAMSIKFNLRGEPLLSKHLIQAVEYARNLGFIDIMINTNGQLLDVETARRLSKAGLTTCIISVDSFWDENYCHIHNCESKDYFRLIRNLTDLHFIKKYNGIDFDVKLNFHLNEYNKAENIEYYKEVFDLFDFVIRRTEKREGEDITIGKRNQKRKRICPHMMRRITVTSNNKIYPCCVCYLEPEDIRLVGDRSDAAFFSRKRANLIKNYKKGIYTESCKNCTSGDIYG